MRDVDSIAGLVGAAAELEATGWAGTAQAAENFGALFERATPEEREAVFSIIDQAGTFG